jgi:PadR family transcriptional regulator PadR
MTEPSASLMSGVSELLILKLLATRELYGYELARTIRVLTSDGIVVGESVLYPTLHLLEKRGLIRSRRKSVDGRTRVYYVATAKGKRRLEGLTGQWQRIFKGVEAVLAGPQDA